MKRNRTEALAFLAALFLPAAVKLLLGGQWGLLADEAYYALWATRLDLGYYDQPPLIAWVLAPLVGWKSDRILRIPAVLAGLFGALVSARAARDRLFVATWWAGVLPLAWLTGFATPDALLLGSWAGCVTCAVRGGRAWWGAAVFGAAAALSKHSGLAVFPLVVWALRDRDAVRPALLWAGLLLPHLVWLATHDFVTVRFQLAEGLLHRDPPGPLGPVAVVVQQLLLLNPLLTAAVFGAWWRPGRSRLQCAAWWTSAPVAAGFFVAAWGGPPEAHWLAPCWIGAGLLLADTEDWRSRAAWAGLGVGLFASLLLIAHGTWGVFRLPDDPRHRLYRGREVAQGVALWALPEGIGMREPGVERALPVLTERYQEAAWIAWYAGIDAWRHPGCGRPDQFDRWPRPLPPRALFVRPARSGPLRCAGPVRARHTVVGQTLDGTVVGRWDVFEIGE